MAAKCDICGSKARRFCPSGKKEICSICCATRRMTEIKCTADCEHNPFGVKAILAFRKLDADSANFIMRYLTDYCSKSQRELEYEALGNRMPMDNDGRIYYFCREKLYHEIQADSRTIFERWRDEKFASLNHDQQLLLEYKRSLKPAVVEFQKNIDGNFAEFIDMLEPELPPFRIMDPDFVGNDYPRFTRMLTYLETYPNFVRFSRGGGQVLSGKTATMFIEQLKEHSEAAGLPPKEYLRKNYAECSQWPSELSARCRAEMLAQADYKICTAKYDIADNYHRIIERLLSRSDMMEDKDPEKRLKCRYFVWLQKDASADFDASEESLSELLQNGNESIPVLGSIALFPDRLELEARSSRKYAFTRQRLEKEFSQQLKFESESIRDIGRELMEPEEEDNTDSVHTRSQSDGENWNEEWLEDMEACEDENEDFDDGDGKADIHLEIQQHIINQTMDKYYREFIDTEVPLLNNITPREAATNASMRPALIELMKDHIRGNAEQAGKHGLVPYNLNWMLDELGVEELK